MGKGRLAFFFLVNKRRKKIGRQTEVRSAEVLVPLNSPSFLHVTCSSQYPLGNRGHLHQHPVLRSYVFGQPPFFSNSSSSFGFDSGQFPNLFSPVSCLWPGISNSLLTVPLIHASHSLTVSMDIVQQLQRIKHTEIEDEDGNHIFPN